MSIGSAWDLSSDAELITAVRSGESAAFGVLYERHVPAARAVARQYTNSAADADDAVQDAFSKVYTAIQSGGGPDVAFRAYLFTVLRRVAMERVESVRRAQPTDDLATFEAAGVAEESSEAPALEGFERGVVSQAYSSLPERWQAVLWYTEVEGLSAHEIAPILGLTANGVAALAYRAREGLRQAYLQQHLAAPTSEACTLVNSKLGAYVRGGLAKRETLLVESHLEECRTCRALVLELGDVNHGMRAIVAPLVLGGALVGVLHGVGFGGAAGAGAGAAAGAAAGAGAGGGVGSAGGGAGAGSGGAGGTGAGTAGGSAGAGAGAGAGAAGAAAAGVGAGAGVGAVGAAVVGVAGAAALAGASSASAAPAGAAGAGGAAGTGAAGAGAAGAAAAGAGAAAGGLAALVTAVAGAPVLVGAVAALVVLGGAVGVAGALGAFDSGPSQPAAAGPSASGPAEPGSPTPGDQATGTPPDTGPSAAPGGEPSATPSSGPSGEEPGGSTGLAGQGSTRPSTPASTPGSTPSPDPTPGPGDPTPTAFPALALDPPTGLTLVAGVPSPVDVVVRNTGDTSATAVRAVLTFDAGTDWEVTPLGGPPAASRGAGIPVRTASAEWTCARTSPTVATCTLPSIAARTAATLRLSVLVSDDTLDGERTVGIGLSTSVAGGRPATAQVSARLSSSPARVVADAPAGVVLVGAVQRTAAVDVVVPVRNAGGTTARDVLVRVALPADLPAGVTLTETSAPGTHWLCTPTSGALECVAPLIGPRRDYPLALRLSVPGVDGADQPLLDTDVSTSLRVTTPDADLTAPVTVRSAPAAVAVDLPATLGLDLGLPGTLAATVHNDGATTARGVVTHVALPAGVVVVGDLPGDPWTCAPAGDGVDCALDTLAPGATRTLTLGVQADDAASGDLVVSVGDVAATSAVALQRPELTLSRALAVALFSQTSGSAGTVSFEVTNTGAGAAAAVVASVTVPSGVVVGPLEDTALGEWTCEQAAERPLSCRLERLPAGASSGLVLPVVAKAATSGQAAVSLTAANAPTPVAGSADVKVTSAGLAERVRFSGGYAVTEVGSPVLTCDQKDDGCRALLRQVGGSAQNNGQDMVAADDPRATLAVPDGRTIVFAGLYWSANRYAGASNQGPDAWTGPLDRVTVTAPDGVSQQVTGSQVAWVDGQDGSSRQYYQSFADVTDLVARGGAGDWRVADVATAATRKDPVRTYYGGWSLVVVYAEPDADQEVAVYDGGAWVGNGSAPTFDFVTTAPGTARFGVVAWEGDRGGDGDRLVLDRERALTPVRWDGTPGSSNDAFTSTAMGSPWANALGIDAKPFVPVSLAAGLHSLSATTSGEQYLVGAVTVTTTG